MSGTHFGSFWVIERGSGTARRRWSSCSCGWRSRHYRTTAAAISAHDAHMDTVRGMTTGSHAYLRDAGARAQRIVDEHRSTPRHPVEQG